MLLNVLLTPSASELLEDFRSGHFRVGLADLLAFLGREDDVGASGLLRSVGVFLGPRLLDISVAVGVGDLPDLHRRHLETVEVAKLRQR